MNKHVLLRLQIGGVCIVALLLVAIAVAVKQEPLFADELNRSSVGKHRAMEVQLEIKSYDAKELNKLISEGSAHGATE